MATVWIELPAPRWISLCSIDFGVACPPDLLEKARARPEFLVGWRRDDLAGLLLRGSSVAWSVEHCPSANLVKVIGKGLGRSDDVDVYLGTPERRILVADRQTPRRSAEAAPLQSESMKEVRALFAALRGLFPGGVTEGLVVDA